MIETLALSAANTNPMLKTYIVCPGFIYGCGEEIFYDYFKMAWLQNPTRLPVIGDGKNPIPTIHILDLIGLVKRVIERKPVAKYIFAVDRTKNTSLKSIISSISKAVGNGEIENINSIDTNCDIPHFNELSINVRAKTSLLFEDPNDDEEEYERKRFKWHCEVIIKFYSVWNCRERGKTERRIYSV